VGRNVNVVLLAAPSARDEVSVGNVLDDKCFPVDEASPISRKNPTEEADRVRNKNPSFGGLMRDCCIDVTGCIPLCKRWAVHIKSPVESFVLGCRIEGCFQKMAS
jgi:hypothetical protein